MNDMAFCANDCGIIACERHWCNNIDKSIPHTYAYLYMTDYCPIAKLNSEVGLERPKGKWIILKHSHNAMCSNCHRTFVDAYDFDNWDNYCRHCGAIMEEMVTEENWDGI